MSVLWSCRKSHFTEESSGFPSLEDLSVTIAEAKKLEPEVFRPLLDVADQGDVITFSGHDPDLNWGVLTDLSRERKKAVRYDYREWREQLDTFRAYDGDEDFLLARKDVAEKLKTAVLSKNVQLFGSKLANDRDLWMCAVGMNLNKAKENHLASYAGRELSANATHAAIGNEGGGEVKRPETSPSAVVIEEGRGEIQGGSLPPFELWFKTHRTVLTAVAFFILLLGVIHRIWV